MILTVFFIGLLLNCYAVYSGAKFVRYVENTQAVISKWRKLLRTVIVVSLSASVVFAYHGMQEQVDTYTTFIVVTQLIVLGGLCLSLYSNKLHLEIDKKPARSYWENMVNDTYAWGTSHFLLCFFPKTMMVMMLIVIMVAIVLNLVRIKAIWPTVKMNRRLGNVREDLWKCREKMDRALDKMKKGKL